MAEPTPEAIAAKRAKALQLRIAGDTYQQIADAVGYAGRSGAYDAVQSELQKTMEEPRKELRALEIERLNRKLRKWDLPAETDPRAMQIWLALAERRAKLLGLDAPTALEITDRTPISQMTDEEKDKRLRAYFERKQNDPNNSLK